MKMKNKKQEQLKTKQKHKEHLKCNRRKETQLSRNAPKLREKPLILIVCEGKNTEPSYFNQFKLVTAIVKPVGVGYNTISLVNRAIALKAEREYNEVWCVFDKDDFKDSDFNSAITKAKANKLKVAYSIQAFEYWLILHFDDHQGARMNRNEYNDKINELLQPYKIQYDGKKSKKISDEFFALLNGIDEKTNENRMKLAIKRAKRNYNDFPHINIAKEESSTTVFKLVEKLLKHV